MSLFLLDGIFLSGVVVGTLVGAAITAPVTYLIIHSPQKSTSIEAFYKGKQAAIKEISMERLADFRQEGIIRKRYYLVIQERLMHNGLPMSPFWEHKFLISDKLDQSDVLVITEGLSSIAEKLLSISELKSAALGLIRKRFAKAASAAK